MGSLEGKVAIVTGAGRGIGRGEALLLAAEGAAVVVNDLGGEWDGTGRDEKPAGAVVAEITAAGGRAVANHDDVSDWEGGQRLVNQAVEAFGGVDILVCNAGILRDRTVFNMTEEEWDEVVRVHMKGHFVPTKFATAWWRQRSKETGGPVGGRIVLTSSESGLYGNAGQANYAAAKAGIASMGIVVAREMDRYGVTCNTICPRARTRLTEATFGDFAVPSDGFDSWHPDNVAPLVAYLCSEAAGGITGQTFCVGGGVVELAAGWNVAGRIKKDERWDAAELGVQMDALFGERPRGAESFPAMGLPAES